MKRGTFRSKGPPLRPARQYEGANPSAPRAPAAVRVADTRDRRIVTSLPKTLPKRSPKYRRWVASRPCCHCHRPGPNQCAHADQNKGLATKSSDETCFPLCVACHLGIGSEGWYPKAERRELESVYGARTRLGALAEGAYPKDWL